MACFPGEVGYLFITRFVNASLCLVVATVSKSSFRFKNNVAVFDACGFYGNFFIIYQI
jgi:hypothetical protein